MDEHADRPTPVPPIDPGTERAATTGQHDRATGSEHDRPTGGAGEQGRQVAESAREHAGDVTSTAREQASRVTDEAVTQGRRVVDQTTTQLREQAREQTDRAAGALERFGQQLGALAEGHPEDAGEADELARRASEWLSRTAGRVEELGFDGVVDEVSRFARRRPGGFLAGAAAAGFLAGRLLRNTAGASGDGAGEPSAGRAQPEAAVAGRSPALASPARPESSTRPEPSAPVTPSAPTAPPRSQPDTAAPDVRPGTRPGTEPPEVR